MDTYQFQDALNLVKGVLPKRGFVPVINNILLKEGRLTATDLRMTISKPVESELNLLLPPKIVDVVNSFSNAEMTMQLDGKLIVKSGTAEFKLTTDEGIDDYPITQWAEELHELPDDFVAVVQSVVFAASDEETRPAFRGVLFESVDGVLTMTASDTHRLAQAEVNAGLPDCRYLIPARGLRELSKLKGKLSIGFTDSAVTFKADETMLVIRLLDEKYPDVSGVIPKENKTTVYVPKLSEHLADVLKRAMLLVDGKNKAVNITVTEERDILGEMSDKMTVKVSSEVGSMEEGFTVKRTGEEVDVFLNAGYLADGLKYEAIELNFNGDGGPVTVTRPGYKYLYLMLPIKKVN